MSKKIKKIGLKILELRRLKGLSQTELAAQLGISQKKLSNLERGYYKNMDIELLEKICNYFNVPIEFFIGTESETGLYTIETLKEDQQKKEDLILEYLKLDDKNKEDIKRMKQILRELLLLLNKVEDQQK